MKRSIYRVTEDANFEENIEVGDGWQDWNKAIGARTGELVRSPDGSLELWCDEEGLMREDARVNRLASLLVMRPIVGDAIVFYPGDVT